MNKEIKPVIISIFMENINPKMIEYQRKVVQKFNRANISHIHVQTDAEPGITMTKVIEMLDSKGADAIMFLDVDCVPLNETAIEYMFEAAYNGKVIGDAQRSNHIQNNQHVFAAPHNLTFTIEAYKKCGSPSLAPNSRGDVGEELTFRAKESNIDVEIIMPIKFDAPPIRMSWEPPNLPPYWDLADGMPKYGIGTTFGYEGNEMFWHMYQSFYPGQDERFFNKCKEILGE
jgi:hypothetical protein